MVCPFYDSRRGKCMYIPGTAYVDKPDVVARIASGGKFRSVEELIAEMCDGPGFVNCRIYRLVKSCALLQEIQRMLSS